MWGPGTAGRKADTALRQFVSSVTQDFKGHVMAARSDALLRSAALILLLCSTAIAQDTYSLRISGTPEQLAGELIDINKKDANGEVCAGLVIESDLDGLSYDSNNGIINVTRQPGRDFLFLSPEEQLVKVMKTGYMPLKIVLSDKGIKLLSGKVWLIKVTGDHPVTEIPISILTTPPGVRIFIDGVDRGTDVTQRILTGRHQLGGTKEGYKPTQDSIEVTPDKTLFNLKLNPIELVEVTFSSRPSGAKIILNGVERGETDKGLFLYPGTYTLKLQKSGCTDVERQITVAEGVKNVFSVDLTRIFGTLELTVSPPDARVVIDKEDYSGRKRIELAPGPCRIEVSMPGYADTSEVLNVAKRDTLRRNYALRARKGSLRFSVQPLQARVALRREGKAVETWLGMKQLTGLLAVDYELDCMLDGYKRVRKPIRVEENQTLVAEITMEKGRVGSLQDDMVLVEGGTFEMGGGDGGSDEQPVHKVSVKSFRIAKHEVNQRQWKEVTKTNPSYFKDCDECPVEDVTWEDAQKYIAQLNEETGRHYRLPTEAEWEYAARGGKDGEGFEYSGSGTLDNVAWFSDNSDSKTHTVGTKRPNKLGLFDMNGNVWEWCSDWYDENYYSNSPEENPAGPPSGTYRVLRGGAWYANSYLCRLSLRFRYSPALHMKAGGYGFRLAED